MNRTRSSVLRFEVPLGIVGSTLVAFAFAFAATGIPRWIPPALTVRFGFASPLTGMTRSFVAMAQGDVSQAFGWHPLGPLCFAACVLAAAYAAATFFTQRRWAWISRTLGTRWFGWGVAAAFALAWVRQIKEVGI